MSNSSFRGVYPILPTPFAPDESVDIASVENMVDKMVDLEVDGVTILGVLGEANRLTDHERAAIVDAAVGAANGRIAVVAGASHRGTRATVLLAEMAARQGADAVMIAPHKEATPSEAKVFEHFRTVASGVGLPVRVAGPPRLHGRPHVARPGPRHGCEDSEHRLYQTGGVALAASSQGVESPA